MTARSLTIALLLVCGTALATPVPSRCAAPASGADRVAVEKALVDAGLTGRDAAERVAALTDSDITSLARQIDQLRAAGGLNRWQIAAIVVAGIVATILMSAWLGG